MGARQGIEGRHIIWGSAIKSRQTSKKESRKGKGAPTMNLILWSRNLKKLRESRGQIQKERKERDDKRMALEQDQHVKIIMTIDTSSMDEQSQEYFRLMKEEILSRRFGKKS